ncbi:DUF6290 family protein [Nocardia sienata]|uniref:DUF6290 family protein n=1 Tax=Nocardia sienata TaxID=248552 RepID=UPI0007A3AEAC|nr:DUF6290 family protein [Nocardia sienata]
MAGRSTSLNGSSHGNGNDIVTFSVRIRRKDYKLLEQIAHLYGRAVAEVAREFVLEGIEKALDPEEITQVLERQKEELLRAAEERRTGQVDNA